MDTKGNQKTRRFTKLSWCEKWGKDSHKKVSSRSKETGQAGPTRTASPDVKKDEVSPQFGAWWFAVALLLAVVITGV